MNELPSDYRAYRVEINYPDGRTHLARIDTVADNVPDAITKAREVMSKECDITDYVIDKVIRLR